MPELPEVETVRRGLAPVMEGRAVERLEVRRFDLRFPVPRNLADCLEGRRIAHVNRRGKYLLFLFQAPPHLIMHLGMSGHFEIHGPGESPPPGGHCHLVFHMPGGDSTSFTDPRRFGFALLADDPAAHPHLASMGPEPMSDAFHAGALLARAGTSRAPVKAALLDQRVVAGIGNIYASEALHAAGISPRRRMRNLGPVRADRLVRALRSVLADAIEAGGSTLRDHARVDGTLGYFQHRFRVYGRHGQPCPVQGCTGSIRQIVQSGRSSFYCPRCQR